MALKLFADQAATAIDNARLHDEVKHRLEQLTQITDLTRTVLVSNDIDDVVQHVAEPIKTLFNANSLIVTKWDEERKVAQILISKGQGLKPSFSKETLPGAETISEIVLKQNQPMVFIRSEVSKKFANSLINSFQTTLF
jgi:transcriptional regulator with GAF, ATPase, and Fis domain